MGRLHGKMHGDLELVYSTVGRAGVVSVVTLHLLVSLCAELWRFLYVITVMAVCYSPVQAVQCLCLLGDGPDVRRSVVFCLFRRSK